MLFWACAAATDPSANIALVVVSALFPTPTTPTCFAVPAIALENADDPTFPLNSPSSIIARTAPPEAASNALSASHVSSPVSAPTSSSRTAHTTMSAFASRHAAPFAATSTPAIASAFAGAYARPLTAIARVPRRRPEGSSPRPARVVVARRRPSSSARAVDIGARRVVVDRVARVAHSARATLRIAV